MFSEGTGRVSDSIMSRVLDLQPFGVLAGSANTANMQLTATVLRSSGPRPRPRTRTRPCVDNCVVCRNLPRASLFSVETVISKSASSLRFWVGVSAPSPP